MSSSDSTGSSSTSAFVSTLIFNGIIFVVFISIFLLLRKKQRIVYEPKTLDLRTTDPQERPPALPEGRFAWIGFLLSRPQSFLIQYAGIDGYLFIRYLSIFAGVSFLGCIILFPILLPVNATNGHNLSGFELLAFANVSHRWRFFAHAFLSWIYFGFIIFIVYKELVFYTSLRHAIQTTPFYDGLLSSRTLLLTDIPDEYLEEENLKKVFPVYNRVWYSRDCEELQKLVKERTKLAGKYEGALNKIISKGVKLNKKLVKKGKPLPEAPEDYIKKNPTHRLGKIPFIGKKVDTVEYSIERLDELNEDISEKQSTASTQKQTGSVFIEFQTQLEAQRAYQAIPYTNFPKAVIGVGPDEIVWDNLGMNAKAKKSKRILANTFLSVLILFWAIPVLVVGCISNINFLTDKVHFLRFINNCPKVILGLITGILPTVALAILMSLVPVIISKAGKLSGAITKQEINLYCQSWYYGFQVIQVFLVMTLASAATSTVTAIIKKPKSAMNLLAENLPKASNFYIAYFILLGLTFSGKTFLRAVPLLLSKVLAFLKNTPRKKFEFQNKLSGVDYGSTYPPYQLLVAIMIIYSIISPIILVFSTVGLALIYFAYLYNLVYVSGSNFDARGRHYPKALMQTFVGLYLAEICLLGLFIMAKSWGPLVLEVVMIVVTVLAHLWIQRQFFPLYDAVPVSAIHEARGEGYLYPVKDQGLAEIKKTGKEYADHTAETPAEDVSPATPVINGNENKYFDEASGAPKQESPLKRDSSSSKNETFIDKKSTGDEEANTLKNTNIATETNIDHLKLDIKKDPKGVLKRFFSPKTGYNFTLIRKTLPSSLNYSSTYSKEFLDTAYVDSSVSDDVPHIWIPRDSLGISAYEINRAQGKVDVFDGNTEYNEKGKYDVTGPPPAYEDVVKV